MSETTSENGVEHLCHWVFICDSRSKEYDGRTQFEVVKEALKNMHIAEPNLFPKKYEVIGVSKIRCLTYETKMKRAAEYLRNQVYVPYCFYGYPYPQAFPPMRKYLHTPGGGFYTWCEHGWKTDTLDTPVNSLGVDESSVQPLSVSDSAAETVLPSQVLNKEFIYYPPSEMAIQKMGENKGGKWMVHSPGCMDLHDKYWLDLIKLCQEGILVGIKASTAMIKEGEVNDLPGFRQFRREDPVIMCYTANSGDIAQVRRAVHAIRKVVNCEYVLYYKTNSASSSGMYYHEGWKSVTQYMHTVEGELYKRDKMKRWEWVKY